MAGMERTGTLCEVEVDGVCRGQAVQGFLSDLLGNSVFIWRTKENHERLFFFF